MEKRDDKITYVQEMNLMISVKRTNYEKPPLSKPEIFYICVMLGRTIKYGEQRNVRDDKITYDEFNYISKRNNYASTLKKP
jgi:hypothetical protein